MVDPWEVLEVQIHLAVHRLIHLAVPWGDQKVRCPTRLGEVSPLVGNPLVVVPPVGNQVYHLMDGL